MGIWTVTLALPMSQVEVTMWVSVGKLEEAGEVTVSRGASGDYNCPFTTGPSILGVTPHLWRAPGH